MFSSLHRPSQVVGSETVTVNKGIPHDAMPYHEENNSSWHKLATYSSPEVTGKVPPTIQSKLTLDAPGNKNKLGVGYETDQQTRMTVPIGSKYFGIQPIQASGNYDVSWDSKSAQTESGMLGGMFSGNVTAVDSVVPNFPACGTNPFFEWCVNFNTTMPIGYIVQKIENTWFAQNCDGTPYTGYEPTPRYWERWYVENKKLSNRGVDRSSGAHDCWRRGICGSNVSKSQPCPPYASNTWGIWTMKGTLYLYEGTDLDGFSTAGGVSDAGSLEHTTKDPGDDVLGRPKGTRVVVGHWDCCPPNLINQQLYLLNDT